MEQAKQIKNTHIQTPKQLVRQNIEEIVEMDNVFCKNQFKINGRKKKSFELFHFAFDSSRSETRNALDTNP